MGKDKKRTAIIEFNGLPGCGKSTLCNKLVQTLKGNDYISVYTPKRDKQSQIRYLFLSLFDIKNIAFIISLISYSINIHPLRARLKAIRTVLMYKGMYAVFFRRKKNGLLMVDQGLLQGLLSIAHIDKIPRGHVVGNSILKAFVDGNIYRINCNCDDNILISRITTRGSKTGRLDCMDAKMLQNALKIQRYNIGAIRKSIDTSDDKFLDINTNYNIKHNLDVIISYLQGVV